MPRVLHTSILDTTAKRLDLYPRGNGIFPMFQTRLPLIQSWRRERERKENWREEFAWIRVVLTRKKYGRGISAPARTAINHIISVNGACKTREGSASLFALSYNTERSGTRAVVCPIVTMYYVEHVYSRWGASGEDREALPDVQRRGVRSFRWNGAIMEFGSFGRWK